MNESEPERDSGQLRPRTVAIVFGAVALVWVIVCLSVGAWPLALGLPLALLLLPVMWFVLNALGTFLILVPLAALFRLFPRRFRSFATQKRLHPAVAFLIFAAFVALLILIFRDISGVFGGLLAIAFLAGICVGLPALADWSRKRKRNTANNTSELTSGGRADASPGGSST